MPISNVLQVIYAWGLNGFFIAFALETTCPIIQATAEAAATIVPDSLKSLIFMCDLILLCLRSSLLYKYYSRTALNISTRNVALEQ